MPVPRLLADTVLTVAPKAAGGALTLVLGLVLVGHLDAAEYGRYAYAVTLILLADAVIGTPFDLAVIRLAQARIGAEPAAAEAAERAALWLKLALTAALAAVAGLAWGQGAGGLMPLVAAASVALMALRSALLHLQMRQRFRAYGAVEAGHVALKLGPAFALVAAGKATAAAVLACLAAGPALALALALPAVRPAILRPAVPRADALPVARLVGWYFPTLALGATLARADILILGALMPGPGLGAYGAAAVAASVPGMLGLYLGVVLTPRVVPRAAEGTLRPVFARIQIALTAAALALGAGAAALLMSAAPAAIPPDYAEAPPIFAILLPGMLVAMTTSAMALPLVMVARKTFLLRLDLVVAPLAVAGWLLAIPAQGATGAAVVTLAVTLVRSLGVLAAAWAVTARPARLD